jgi:uncharacterized protein YlxW (UPF0749 family)
MGVTSLLSKMIQVDKSTWSEKGKIEMRLRELQNLMESQRKKRQEKELRRKAYVSRKSRSRDGSHASPGKRECQEEK